MMQAFRLLILGQMFAGGGQIYNIFVMGQIYDKFAVAEF